MKVMARRSTDFRSLRDPAVIQAMHYIRHHACKGIKVEQVLDAVGMSRSNLEKRFKDEVGQTIHGVIHEENSIGRVIYWRRHHSLLMRYHRCAVIHRYNTFIQCSKRLFHHTEGAP